MVTNRNRKLLSLSGSRLVIGFIITFLVIAYIFFNNVYGLRQIFLKPGNIANNQAEVYTQTPDILLGSMQPQFFDGGKLMNGNNIFYSSQDPSLNHFSLEGRWIIKDQQIEPVENAILKLNFYAKKVFLTAKPKNGGIGKFQVYFNDELIDDGAPGDDVKGGLVIVDLAKSYNLVKINPDQVSHILKLQFLTPNIEALSFQFN